ncbi:MAG: hypothetical protein OXB88_05175 [Bacteriovoracales bacterium]|nr:hypothetical protein [Bacteriovoracales bacterium]
MAKRWRKEIQLYDYECSLSGEKFRMTKPAPNPSELISVKAYYELYPEKDDRPEVIKKRAQAQEVILKNEQSEALDKESSEEEANPEGSQEEPKEESEGEGQEGDGGGAPAPAQDSKDSQDSKDPGTESS